MLEGIITLQLIALTIAIYLFIYSYNQTDFLKKLGIGASVFIIIMLFTLMILSIEKLVKNKSLYDIKPAVRCECPPANFNNPILPPSPETVKEIIILKEIVKEDNKNITNPAPPTDIIKKE